MKTPKPSLAFQETRITAKEEISPGVFLLSFPRTFSFRAGQVIGIRLQSDEPHRLYSIASGEHEDVISLLFDINPGGFLTPRLASLQEGDKLFHSQAFGFFSPPECPAYWIATGTGIAPFRSMLRSGSALPLTLLQGARGPAGFYFADEFGTALGKNHVCCSSRELGPGLFDGRVTRYLQEMLEPDPKASFLLCGSAEMVVEVRDLLISRGVAFSHIRAEIYF